MIYCIADESYKKFDNKISRTSVCVVEFTDLELISKEFEGLIKTVENDNVRFNNKLNKLHSSELTAPQVTFITEKISKMKFSAKIYTKYIYDKSEKDCKVETMQLAVEHLKCIHINKETTIKIESAEEYKDSKLAKLCGDLGDKYSLLPDIILAVFLHILDDKKPEITNNSNYNLLREKIRLQVFALDKTRRYLDKTKRL